MSVTPPSTPPSTPLHMSLYPLEELDCQVFLENDIPNKRIRINADLPPDSKEEYPSRMTPAALHIPDQVNAFAVPNISQQSATAFHWPNPSIHVASAVVNDDPFDINPFFNTPDNEILETQTPHQEVSSSSQNQTVDSAPQTAHSTNNVNTPPSSEFSPAHHFPGQSSHQSANASIVTPQTTCSTHSNISTPPSSGFSPATHQFPGHDSDQSANASISTQPSGLRRKHILVNTQIGLLTDPTKNSSLIKLLREKGSFSINDYRHFLKRHLVCSSSYRRDLLRICNTGLLETNFSHGHDISQSFRFKSQVAYSTSNTSTLPSPGFSFDITHQFPEQSSHQEANPAITQILDKALRKKQSIQNSRSIVTSQTICSTHSNVSTLPSPGFSPAHQLPGHSSRQSANASIVMPQTICSTHSNVSTLPSPERSPATTHQFPEHNSHQGANIPKELPNNPESSIGKKRTREENDPNSQYLHRIATSSTTQPSKMRSSYELASIETQISLLIDPNKNFSLREKGWFSPLDYRGFLDSHRVSAHYLNDLLKIHDKGRFLTKYHLNGERVLPLFKLFTPRIP